MYPFNRWKGERLCNPFHLCRVVYCIISDRSVQREVHVLSSNNSAFHETGENPRAVPSKVTVNPTPKWIYQPSPHLPDSRMEQGSYRNGLYGTAKHHPNNMFPYRGTAEKIRYTSLDPTIRLYPGEARSLSIHPPSEGSVNESLCGRSNSKETRNRYLRQYRNHRRVTSFHSPTSDTILILVNYHFSHYRSISFLDSTYFPTFAQLYPTDFDVLYIGASCHPKYKVLKNAHTVSGHYSYHSFRLVYDLFSPEQYPYRGYLFMNDDSYVDPQFLSSYNLSTSWAEPSVPYNGSMKCKWNSALNVNKIRYSEAFYHAMDEIVSDQAMNRRCSYTSPGALRKGWSDFFYIYRSDVTFFLTLEEVMFRHRVFLEFAVPTILHCINPKPVVDCNHRQMENRLHCVHVHPVKLSQSDLRSYVKKRLWHKNLYEIPIVQYCSV